MKVSTTVSVLHCYRGDKTYCRSDVCLDRETAEKCKATWEITGSAWIEDQEILSEVPSEFAGGGNVPLAVESRNVDRSVTKI